MKDIVTFIIESKKNLIHKNTQKIAKLTAANKYKTKDNNLKKKLEEFTKKFKKKLNIKVKESLFEGALDEWKKNKKKFMDAQKESVLDEISNFMQNNIDDWKTCWDSPDDMDRDLDTAEDWFWNECDNYIDDLLCGVDDPDAEIPKEDLWDYISSNWGDDINKLISGLCDEARDYANDKYFDDEDRDDYYGNDDEWD